MTIKVAAYASDGGDGGGSIIVYNDLNELREDCFKPDKWHSEEDCEKKFQAALNGESHYEYGEIIQSTMEIETNPDGSLRLAKSLRLHYGQ